jgi:hypothetical protein
MQTSQEYAWRLLAAIAKGRAAMSAFGGKSGHHGLPSGCPLLTQSGRCPLTQRGRPVLRSIRARQNGYVGTLLPHSRIGALSPLRR